MNKKGSNFRRPVKIQKASQYIKSKSLYLNMEKRFIQVLLVAFGFCVSIGIRCNVGVTTVKMMSLINPFKGDTKLSEFQWTPETIGFVDASFFWGYIVTQIPGGLLAAKYSPTMIFGTSIFLSSCLNMLIPLATTLSGPRGLGIPVILIRVLQGLFEGLSFPSVHGILRWWAPPQERAILATLAYTGVYIGPVVGMPVSGFLSDQIGWYAPYYFYGVLGMIWFLFWTWLAFEKPCTHPSISSQEQSYIEQSIGIGKISNPPTIRSTPWAKIFTSMPVWAIIVANFARSWTFYLLIIEEPKYFSDVFKMSLSKGTGLGALPYLLMSITVPLGGQLADWLRKKDYLTNTNLRKTFNCGGFGFEALFLLVVCYSKNVMIATIGLVFSVGCSGFAISGFQVNHLDIAPRYASILMGITNSVGTLSGMICPILTEQIIKNHNSKLTLEYEWSQVFLVASIIHFLGVIFYAIFASGELEPWAEHEKVRRK